MSESMENETDKLLTIKEVAELLQVNESTIYRYMSDEENPLPSYKVKGITRIKKSELDAWIEKQK